MTKEEQLLMQEEIAAETKRLNESFAKTIQAAREEMESRMAEYGESLLKKFAMGGTKQLQTIQKHDKELAQLDTRSKILAQQILSLENQRVYGGLGTDLTADALLELLASLTGEQWASLLAGALGTAVNDWLSSDFLANYEGQYGSNGLKGEDGHAGLAGDLLTIGADGTMKAVTPKEIAVVGDVDWVGDQNILNQVKRSAVKVISANDEATSEVDTAEPCACPP